MSTITITLYPHDALRDTWKIPFLPRCSLVVHDVRRRLNLV